MFYCYNDYLKYYFPKRFEDERRKRLTESERVTEDVHLLFEKLRPVIDNIFNEKEK